MNYTTISEKAIVHARCIRIKDTRSRYACTNKICTNHLGKYACMKGMCTKHVDTIDAGIIDVGTSVGK